MPLFNFIKTKLSILDIVSDYIRLRQAGTYWKGPCPFHSEKEASFTVSPDKQIFYCFGCHAGGDLIAFVAKMENLSQIEATKFLIDRYSLVVPEEIKKQAFNSADLIEKKEGYFDVCKKVSQWCNDQLLNNPKAKDYLRERKITQKQAKYFNIGYFPGGVRAINRFVKEMSRSSVLVQDLLEAGILHKGQSVLYSPFEERIIFPIKDGIGRYCGFGGRIFKELDQRAKYYNSKESEWFLKGSLLFGLDLAKKEMQKKSVAYLVEGYTDCVAMAKYGYLNTVATLGTACTQEHLKTLSRYIKTLYVLFDGDQAGQKAILRLTQFCWEVNLELQIVKLPPEDDPASFLEKNGNLDELIAGSCDIFNFFVESLGRNFLKSSLGEKLNLSQNLIQIIIKLDDPIKRDLLLQRASGAMQVAVSALKDRMVEYSRRNLKNGKNNGNGKELVEKEIENTKNNQKDVPVLEERIFSAIINSEQKGKSFQIEKDLTLYFSEYIQFLLKSLQNFKQKATDSTFSGSFFKSFLDNLEESDKNWVIKCSMKYDQEVAPVLFEQLISHFCKQNWRNIVQDIKLKLLQAKQQGNKQRLQELLGLFSKLRQGIYDRGLI